MSYAVSAALQAAIYQKLSTDAAVAAIVGGDIFDEMPGGPVPDLYAALGAETVQTRHDSSGAVAEHRLTVSVVSQRAGFAAAKLLAGAIADVLGAGDLALTRGRVISIRLERTQAVRTGRAGRVRRIDMRFRVTVEDDEIL